MILTREIKKHVESKKFKHYIYLNFQLVIIRLNIESDKVYKELKDYFREFVCVRKMFAIEIYVIENPDFSMDLEFTIKQPDPGKKKIKEEFFDCSDGKIVRKRLTNMHFLFTQRRNLAIGPCLENINQVVNFVNNRFISRMLNNKYLLFHSSAVSYGSKGMAISGFSGMGKSTLALHLMNRGVSFVSNDRLLVGFEDARLIMFGVAKYPRINPGTIVNNETLQSILPQGRLDELMNLTLEELWNLEEKYDGFIDELFGEDKFTISSPLNALVILNWYKTKKKCRIRQVKLQKRSDLHPAFMKSPGLFFLDGKSGKTDLSAMNYVKYLKECNVYEVTGGIDFKYATDFFIDIMQEQRG